MENKIERLSIGKLEITPYFYDEDHGYRESEPLQSIEVKAKMGQEQFLELAYFILANYSSDEYLPVIRHGISEDPVEMRFGPYLWSRDTGGIKAVFMLVSRIAGEKDNLVADTKAYWSDPIDMNTFRGLVNQVETMEKLLGTLREKGIIDDDDVFRISENKKEGLQRRRIDYQEVDDIDNKYPVGVTIRYKDR